MLFKCKSSEITEMILFFDVAVEGDCTKYLAVLSMLFGERVDREH